MRILASEVGYMMTTEMEEFRRMIAVAFGGDEKKNKGMRISTKDMAEDENKLVCVTSGVSFLGLAIVNCLLARGYSVRVIVDNQEDIEKLKEMETSGQVRTNSRAVVAVMARLAEWESLCKAFEGCRGVFHTSAFTDPAGLSGYSKTMAEIEVKASENVMKACARTPSVRKCVLTSSLLSCIWRDNTQQYPSTVINHECWSDESICIDKKLWYALGKLRAEKAAWRMAKETGLKLTTICPGLITGPEFCSRNPTATIAYLKGAQEMYKDGLLATVDVIKLAQAHVCVFKSMNKTAFGRYICFDQIIRSNDEAEKLAQEVEMPVIKIHGNATEHISTRFELSDSKLTNLMSRTLRSCYYENQTL